jgi:hypothetical protein
VRNWATYLALAGVLAALLFMAYEVRAQGMPWGMPNWGGPVAVSPDIHPALTRYHCWMKQGEWGICWWVEPV